MYPALTEAREKRTFINQSIIVALLSVIAITAVILAVNA